MMASFFDSLSRVRLIAANTYREAVRQKVLLLLMFTSLALLLAVGLFRAFDFSERGAPADLRFISGFGYACIAFFAAFVPVVSACQLMFNELETRRHLLVLARPVRHWEFVAGKLLGVWGVAVTFIVITSLLVSGQLLLRSLEAGLLGHPDASVSTRIMDFCAGNVAVHAVSQCLRALVVTAFATLVCTFSRSFLYALGVSLMAVLAFEVQHVMRTAWEGSAFASLLSCALPDLQLFSMGDMLSRSLERGAELPVGTLWRLAMHALGHSLAYLSLGALALRSREP